MTNFERYITNDLLNGYLENEGLDYRVKIASVTKRNSDDLWVEMDFTYCGESLGRYGYAFIATGNSYGGYTEEEHYTNRVLNILNGMIGDMDEVLREQNMKKLINKI